MRKSHLRKENGAVEVEATFILPIAILCVLLLLYLSLFMFQKANLQAGLETTLVYFKNTITDAYVTKNTELNMVLEDNTYVGSGNSFVVDSVLNPYKGMFGDAYGIANDGGEAFKTYFRSVAGNMLFDDENNLKIDVQYKNSLIYKEIEVAATQEVTFPIDFSFIGVGKKGRISATARTAVVDHEDLIRNVDYAIDIVEDTQIGTWEQNIAAKVSEAYNKMRELLGAS